MCPRPGWSGHGTALVFLLLAALSGFSGAETTDPLPRRPFLGLAFDLSDTSARGLRIQRALPGSAAERAGMLTDDRLVSLGSVDIVTFTNVTDILAASKPGQPIQVSWNRDGELLTASVPLGALPTELIPHATVSYRSVAVDGVRQRLIVTHPDDAPTAPIVFYIQGLGCSSVDYGFDPDSPIKRLIDAWTASGYATARLEKRGMGDSEGDCSTLDFHTERKGYDAALAALVVDGFKGRIFLFGHSLGGVMAPLLVDDHVAGIMVYGTVATPWFDYMMTNFARQDELAGIPPTVVRSRQSLRDRFQRGLLFDGKSPAELIELIPGASDLGDVQFAMGKQYYGRHMHFFQQLASIEPLRVWQQVKPPVLALHGEFDWVSSSADHRDIAAWTEGEFRQVDAMDHGFLTYPDLETSFKNRNNGQFGVDIVTTTTTWMDRLRHVEPEPQT